MVLVELYKSNTTGDIVLLYGISTSPNHSMTWSVILLIDLPLETRTTGPKGSVYKQLYKPRRDRLPSIRMMDFLLSCGKTPRRWWTEHDVSLCIAGCCYGSNEVRKCTENELIYSLGNWNTADWMLICVKFVLLVI